MAEDAQSTNGFVQGSWIDKLRNAFAAEPKDRDQLIDVLRESQKRSLFDADALAMIEGVLHVSEMQVRDIMIPRSQVVVLERDLALDKMLRIIVDSGHSRFPVVGESKDEVLGILLAKDMLGLVSDEENQVNSIRDMLRRPVFVPESKRLNVLLKEFRSSRNHMAIVVDEYGGVSGIITIEDVLEQIVGEIADEHDVEEGSYILEHQDQKFTVKALTPIEDFNEFFNTKYANEEFDTIGGLLLNRLGHLPKRNETVNLDDLMFKILRADNRRIHLIQVSIEKKKVSLEEG